MVTLIVLGFNDSQLLWVILCLFPEKGRKEIHVEEIVEEMKEKTGKKEEQE